MKPKKTIDSVWEVWTYDVWGNRQDGYEVNDRFCLARHYHMRLKIHTYNVGTPFEFESAGPTNYQLQKLFGTRAKLDTFGDDLHIYVERESDGYPIGELHCMGHSSLSPIRVCLIEDEDSIIDKLNRGI